MISAEVEGRGPFMTYPEPWRGPPKQQPEFLRPQPKPLQINKYNGLSGPPLALNGTRVVHNLSHASVPKYSPPAAAPVNLTQHQPLKEEMAEELTFAYRPYPTQSFTGYPHPQYHLYPNHYLMATNSRFVTTPMTPMDQFSSSAVPATTGTFLSPAAAYSPPAKAQIIRTERTSQSLSSPLANQNFKVPSGKEGSLKHRILQIRPEENVQKCAIDLHKPLSQEAHRKRLPASAGSPPQSPATKTAFNNNSMSANFAKGCIIQLENGDFKKLEEMKTEDFVMSAEISTDLRLADSTVVKIEENPITGTVNIMLTYNQRRTQADVEYPIEHPFFVYGKGWASCNPDRTLHSYGLKVHRLQVGDVIISLTPRTENSASMSSQSTTRMGATYTTTATTTAMTVRQVCTSANQQKIPSNHSISHITSNPISPESLAKKRRWSAPSQIEDEEDQDEPTQRKIKHE